MAGTFSKYRRAGSRAGSRAPDLGVSDRAAQRPSPAAPVSPGQTVTPGPERLLRSDTAGTALRVTRRQARGCVLGVHLSLSLHTENVLSCLQLRGF